VFWCWKWTINTEFICNNIVVKWMSVSVQNYKIIVWGVPFPDVFARNKSDLLSFSGNILRQFHFNSEWNSLCIRILLYTLFHYLVFSL
jgi:hypothetical protein